MPLETHIQTAFVSGELSPALWGRVDHEKFKFGASTMRNGYVNFQGGYSSRAGLAYVGMCKQGAPNAGGTSTSNPPRDISFQFSVTQSYVLEFGDLYMRIKYQGAYITETAENVSAITRANPGVFTVSSHGYNNGDWVFPLNIGGMTSLNGLTYIVQNKTTNTFTLTDLFGNAIDTSLLSAYTSGGTFARIYTVVSPYAAIDLPYLKFTQSADEMSLTCWNQSTLTEYQPYDLVRSGNTSWAFTATTFGSTIAAPSNVAATAQNSTTKNTWYSYVVTAFSSDEDESVASSAVYIQNNNISVNAGSNTITWSPVAGASYYNVYSSTPYYSTGGTAPVQVGVSYGYTGNSLGTSFVDSNIVADFTTTPPIHADPFARGQINGVTITAGGSGYSQAGVTYTITTSTGTGFSGTPIILGDVVNGFYITNPGKNYALTDTITFTADGSSATANLVVGPETSTYPGVVSYFQERRGYASTQNNPDTYYFSHPATFTTMDTSIPISADDAIIGTPWAQQVNGIQFMTPMPGGLVVFTGGGAWQLSGGTSIAFTPIDQTAQPQSRYGCSSTVPPIPVNFHILFVRENNGVVYDLVFNFYANIYTGSDLTLYSNHLFNGYTIVQWAYAEKPSKLVWAVRNDGTLLCMTYIAEQQEQGWSRHDTNGLFIGVCSVEEPPVDAVYCIVQRYIQGHWVYYSERFNNRIWLNSESCFCVDSGLSYPMTFPNATLTPASARGTGNITSTFVVEPGAGYVNPTATAVDSTDLGSGATFSIAVASGGIISVTPLTTGEDYTSGATQIVITDDDATTDAIVNPTITNYVTFTASASVFTPGMVGDVIRIGNGKATIVTYISGTQVVANITQPITATIPNDPNETPIPAIAGTWSISTPTETVTGLNHLEGLTVTGLADGGVIEPTVVEDGQIILPVAASQITVGLAFLPQLQALYLDIATPNTIQTKRKNIPSVGIRVHDTRGISAGSNQPDASTVPGQVNLPWTNMVQVKERNLIIPMGQSPNLFTGDYFVNIGSDWKTGGQLAVMQTFPLPLNADAFISYYSLGDT